MKEAERLAMRTYTNERSYACSASLFVFEVPGRSDAMTNLAPIGVQAVDGYLGQ